jgi:hypothetical protein
MGVLLSERMVVSVPECPAWMGELHATHAHGGLNLLLVAWKDAQTELVTLDTSTVVTR